PLPGGTNVTVSGSDFALTELLSCVFLQSPGTTASRRETTMVVRAHWLSHDAVVCTVPAPAITVARGRVSALVTVSNNGIDVTGPWVPLEYSTSPVVGAIAPRGGPKSGGTRVFISGQGFVNSSELFCRFGTRSVSATYVSFNVLSCVAPMSLTPAVELDDMDVETVALSTSNNGKDYGDSVPFFYYAEARIFAISPRVLTVEEVSAGGKKISVFGRGFIENFSSDGNASSSITCQFSDYGMSPATFIRQTLVECPIPSNFSAGQVVVAVSNNGIDFTQSLPGASLNIVSAPRALSVFPNAGPKSGGTLVQVHGSYSIEFVEPQCVFRFPHYEIKVQAETRSRAVVICTTPAVHATNDSGGVVQAFIRVELDSATQTQATHEPVPELEFMYYPAIVVNSIWPTTGSAFTPVTLSGEGFIDSPGLLCRFGGNVVAPAGVITSNMILCKVPPEKIYTVVTVEVTNNNADWTSSGLTFTYRPPTTLSGMSPKFGLVNGSTVVKISGSGLNKDTKISCRFGTTTVVAVFESANGILCLAPVVSEAGSVSVFVVENGVDLTPGGWTFTYIPGVQVTSGGPLAGPERGGTVVTMSTLGVLESASIVCEFGSARFRVTGIILNAVAFTCEAPPHGPGFISLKVSVNGQHYADTGLLYEYRPQSSVRSISPEYGPVHGGTTVALAGAGFINSTALVCRVGETLAEAEYVDSTRIICRLPGGPKEDAVSVVPIEVSDNGVDFTSSSVKYKYVPIVAVTSSIPNTGPTVGGTPVRVIGKGFPSTGNLSCVFEDTPVEALVKGPEELFCVTPPRKESGLVNVKISSVGGSMATSSLVFVYHDPVQVLSIFPRTVPEHGGSMLLVLGAGFVKSDYLACVFDTADGSRDSYSVPARFVSDSLVACEPPRLDVGNVSLGISTNGVDVSHLQDAFMITSASTVTSIWPSSGSTNGGTMVRVQGTGFVNSTVLCRFGEKSVAPNVVLDSTTIVCRAPPYHRAEKVALEVTNNNKDWTTSDVMFTYKSPVEAGGIYPRVGPLRGGTVVHITTLGALSDRMEAVWCRFGAKVVTASRASSDGTILCVSPDAAKPTSVPLELSINGIDFTSSGWRFTYTPELKFDSAAPLSGPEHGGTPVFITASEFPGLDSTVCEFGSVGLQVRAIWVDDSTISCTAPAHMPGAAMLRVGLNEQQLVDTGFTFNYLPIPSVLSAVPNIGSVLGGTMVEVRGAGFMDSTELTCRFGDQVVRATYLETVLVRCRAPASRNAPTVLVQVSNNGVEFGIDGAEYSYVPALTVRDIQPPSGPVSGGTTVTVLGTGFAGGGTIHCRIGGRPSSAVIVSDSELLCTAPAQLTAGPLPLELSNNGVDKIYSGTNFTYTADILLRGVHPAISKESGGETVVVSGENFIASPWLVCRFGAESTVPASWLSSTSVSCIVPPSPSGPHTVMLSLSNNGQDFADDAIPFTFQSDFTLHMVEPRAGPSRGGTEITLSGTGLGEGDQWVCLFGDKVAVPAMQLSGDKLRCVTPSMPPGSVTIRAFRSPSSLSSAMTGIAAAAIADGSLPYFGLTFLFQGTVYVASVEPSSGSTTGGTPITVRGSGFTNSTSLTCGFLDPANGMETSPASFISATMAICSTPSHSSRRTRDGHSIVSVVMSLNGVDFSSHGPPQFLYNPPVLVRAVAPALGSEDGGTTVTVIGQGFIPSDRLSCRFGSLSLVRAEFVTSETIRCRTPQSTIGPANVSLAVTNNFVEFSETSALFEYRAAALGQDFSPSAGPLSGGTKIQVTGRNFRPTVHLACRFGASVVEATVVSTSQLSCVSPASGFPKSVAVEITFNGVDWTVVGSGTGKDLFWYYNSPQLDGLRPSTGPLQGGTLVTVFGRFLEPAFKVGKNTVPVLCRPAQYFTSGRISCLTPVESVPGSLEVEVTINGVDFTSQGLVHYFLPMWIVSQVVPAVGSVEGGDIVRIDGAGFEKIIDSAVMLSCRWKMPGASPPELQVTEARVVSDSALECMSPYSTDVGVASLSILADGIATKDAQKLDFLYRLPARVLQLSPPHGPLGGGTVVTIRGLYFSPSDVLACHIGSEVVPATYHSATEVSCRSPGPTVPGPSVLAITDNGVDFAPAGNFTFLPEPTVFKISPRSGPTSGGTVAILQGTGFSGLDRPTCSFGGVVVEANISSPTEASCKTPQTEGAYANEIRKVEITYSNNGVDFRSVASRDNFTYYPDPIIMSVSPSGDVVGGGSTAVILSGANFFDPFGQTSGPREGFMCRLGAGGPSFKGRVVTSMKAECIVTCGSNGRFDMAISLNGGWDWTSSRLSFYCDRLPEVKTISPRHGPASGGTAVTISGAGFVQGSELQCLFGGENNTAVAGSWMSSSALRCIAPASKIDGQTQAVVAVSNDGIHFSSSTSMAVFSYTDPITIQRIHPTWAYTNGNSSFVVIGTNFVETEELQCGLQPKEGTGFGRGEIVAGNAQFLNKTAVLCHTPNGFLPTGPSTVAYSSASPGHDGTFNFMEPPFVTGVRPLSGPDTGGTVLTVQGTGFSSTHTFDCEFGGPAGLRARAIVTSPFEMTCIVPPASATLGKEVDVTFEIRTSPCCPVQVFLYEDAIEVSSLSPTFLLSSGGTPVTLHGAGFPQSDGTLCRFGFNDTWATSFGNFITEEKIMCIAPPNPLGGSGDAQVQVSICGEIFQRPGLAVHYVSPMEIISIKPSHVQEHSVEVTVIEGSNFPDLPDLACRFEGRVSSPALWLRSTGLSCQTPNFLAPGKVGVEVTFNGIEYFDVPQALVVKERLSITGVVPSVGPIYGGTNVTVTGTGFGNAGDAGARVACLFGEALSQAVILEEGKVVCTSP
ncbi:unnamed protein product, partial [Discosporangium mesarthrocarpum]